MKTYHKILVQYVVIVLFVVGGFFMFRSEYKKNKQIVTTTNLNPTNQNDLVVSSPVVSTITAEKLVDLTNKARESEGLKPLKINKLLEKSAALKAKDMEVNNYFGHESISGTPPWKWFDKVGYHYVYAGENLATDYTDPNSLFDAWMQSEGHKNNILNQKFKEIGISVNTFKYGLVYRTSVVQHFGTMYDAKNASSLTNCKFPYSGSILMSKEKCSAMIDCEIEIGKWQAVYKTDCDKLMESILKSMKK